MKLIKPISNNTVQNATEAGTPPPNNEPLATIGDNQNTANTPSLAIAISRPIARAISLPANHLAIARDTVIPAISQPHPKIINPRHANFAFPGRSTHQEFNQVHNSVV